MGVELVGLNKAALARAWCCIPLGSAVVAVPADCPKHPDG